MVSKCANPQCSTPFHYLRDGKVFQMEVGCGRGAAASSNRKPGHHFEHFWLCGGCAASMTLVVDQQRGVVAVPLPRARSAAAY